MINSTILKLKICVLLKSSLWEWKCKLKLEEVKRLILIKYKVLLAMSEKDNQTMEEWAKYMNRYFTE